MAHRPAQAQETLHRYMQQTLHELPDGNSLDNAPDEQADSYALVVPAGADHNQLVAKVGDIWQSWGWRVLERDGFHKPNLFGYAPDGYWLSVQAAPEGLLEHPPTLSGGFPSLPQRREPPPAGAVSPTSTMPAQAAHNSKEDDEPKALDAGRVTLMLWGRAAGAVALALGIAGCVFIGSIGFVLIKLEHSLQPHHMTPKQVRAFEERYRRPGDSNEDQRAFQDFMGKAADEIAALTGASWSWRTMAAAESCAQEGDWELDTRVKKMSTDQVLFHPSIPDRLWLKALDIAREFTKARGMRDYHVVSDQPGERSFRFSSPDGETLELSSTDLIGTTACRLAEDSDISHRPSATR